MVDYLITDFNKIRGGGNIKTDTPTLSDFTTENGILSDGSSDGVFILSDENGYVGSVSLSAASSTVTIMSSVVLTATVLDASSDTIEGKSVIFKLDESIIGSGTTNSSGVATYTYSTDGLGGDMVGEHKVKASCKGVESSEVSLTITKGIPTITLSASSSTVSVGGSVTLSGTLSITNTIIYIYDGTTLVNNTTAGNNGNFSITISNLASGTHSYTAVTEADEKYSSVTSSAVNVTAGSTPTPVVTSVALTTSADSITVGGSATLTATVKDQDNMAMSGETVTFYDGLDSLGTATTNSSGVATKSFSSNTVGVHSLTAKCSNVSSSSVSVIVNSKPAPTISLGASSSSITVGNSVTMSGQLTYNNTGLSNASVKIYNGNTLVDTVSTNSQGYYTKSVSGLTVGTHSFTAVFEGDSTYASVTSSAVSVTVSGSTPVVTSVSLTADKSILSAYDSEYATLTATVLDQSSNPMSGETVSFDIVDSGTVVENIGTAQTNSSGVATVSYYAEGTGDISIQASVGMIVSETYSIQDCLLYDVDGFSKTTTTSTDTTYATGYDYSLASISDFQLEFDFNNPIGFRLYFSHNKVVTTGDNTNYGIGFSRNASDKFVFTERTTTTSNTTCQSISSGTNHYKIKFNGNVVNVWVDDVQQVNNKTLSWWNTHFPYYFDWAIWATGTGTVTNIKIKAL